MQIGSFTAIQDGFSGRLQTLGLDVPLQVVKTAPGSTEKSPDWRVQMDVDGTAIEVGAGWTHEGAKAGAFVALELDCPTLPRPLRANLVRSNSRDDTHVLLWSPRARRTKSA